MTDLVNNLGADMTRYAQTLTPQEARDANRHATIAVAAVAALNLEALEKARGIFALAGGDLDALRIDQIIERVHEYQESQLALQEEWGA